MSPALRAALWPADGLAHEAFAFDDDAALAARTVPFLAEAVDAGQPVVTVVTARTWQLIEDRLGARAHRIHRLADAETFWRSEHDAVLAYHQVMRQHAAEGGPWRSVCEPVLPDGAAGQVWSRYEAALNLRFDALPHYALCLYDRRNLPDDAVSSALRTHPLTWDGTKAVPSPTYLPPQAFLHDAEPPWDQRPEPVATQRHTDVRRTRAAVRTAVAPGWTSRREDIALAVHELVANAVRAAGSAQVATWEDGRHLVWEVADDGPGALDVAAGYYPPEELHESGRGLWMARRLADDSSVRTNGDGTAIRLYFSR